jgi:hypothetical protein
VVRLQLLSARRGRAQYPASCGNEGLESDDCGAAANLIEWENEHTRCYLWTFRVSIEEFTDELTRRTSPAYAQRFLGGFTAARIDERKCA